MNRSVITFLILLTFVFSGCDKSPQPTNQDNDVNHVQPNDTPAPSDSTAEASSDEQGDVVFGDKFPEVLDAEAKSIGDTGWRFSVKLSSSYDSPERYANAWRVLDGNGNELGIRVLGHDHANEQPFTRSGTVQIPYDMKTVFVEGRDQANGWSGQRFEVTLPDVSLDK